MKQWIVLVFLIISPAFFWSQQPKSCDGKKIAASLPPAVLPAINAAVKREDFEAVVKIAMNPDSGLKVISIKRNQYGRIVEYEIHDRKCNCFVASYLANQGF